MLSDFKRSVLGNLPWSGAPRTTTVFSIQGAGYITAMTLTDRNDSVYEIIVDGVSKGTLSTLYNSDAGYGIYNLLIRFNQSFVIKKNTANLNAHIMYVLD
jgi:hypothetical protein